MADRDRVAFWNRPVLVSNGTVCAWDLAERRLLGESIIEHGGEVFAVRATELDGRPIAISAGRDGVVRVWAPAEL